LIHDLTPAQGAVRAGCAPGAASRAATARHYTNLYFRFNRPGPARGRATRERRTDRARHAGEQQAWDTEQPDRGPPAGMQAPNYAVIWAGREPANRTRTQTVPDVSGRLRRSRYDRG